MHITVLKGHDLHLDRNPGCPRRLDHTHARPSTPASGALRTVGDLHRESQSLRFAAEQSTCDVFGAALPAVGGFAARLGIPARCTLKCVSLPPEQSQKGKDQLVMSKCDAVLAGVLCRPSANQGLHSARIVCGQFAMPKPDDGQDACFVRRWSPRWRPPRLAGALEESQWSCCWAACRCILRRLWRAWHCSRWCRRWPRVQDGPPCDRPLSARGVRVVARYAQSSQDTCTIRSGRMWAPESNAVHLA